MRHFLLVLCCVLIPFVLCAQNSYPVDKGNYVLGGSASFSSLGGEELRGEDRAFVFIFNPVFLYFVAPNISLGGTITYQSVSQGDYSDSIIGLGPSAVYFFGDENSTTYPFLGVSYIYTSDEDSYTKNDIRLMGGAAFMVAKNVAITGDVFYLIESYTREDADDSLSGNTLGIEFGVSAFIF